MADLKQIQIPPPYNGMNTVAAPGKCPEGQGPLVRNYLVHYPGKLLMRGPIHNNSPYKFVDTNSIIAEPNIITGAWSFNDKVLIGFMSKSATKYIPHWVVPYYRPTASTNLADASTTAILLDIKAGSATKVTLTKDLKAPTGLGARLEKYVYGHGFGSEATFTDSVGTTYPQRPLLRWDGTSTEPVEYTHGPSSGQFVKAHLNRLWVLAGRDSSLADYFKVNKETTLTTVAPIANVFGMTENEMYKTFHVGDAIEDNEYFAAGTTISSLSYTEGIAEIVFNKNPTENAEKVSGAISVKWAAGSPYEPNTLFFSAQGGPTEDRINMWKDEVSGLVNRIIVGDDDQNDFGVALAVVGQTLVVFKRHSIWALYGYSPSTFQIKNLTKERGCVDPASICEDDGGVYFASQRGIEYFDGSQFLMVDTPIANITRPAIQLHAGEKNIHDASEDFGRISICDIGNDYIFVSIVGQNPNTGVKTSSVWSGYMHTGTGNWSEFSSAVFSSQGIPLINVTTAGVPWLFDGRYIVPFPYLTNPDVAVTKGSAQNDLNTTSIRGIPAKYWTDRIQLASPGYTSQGHRFMFDYKVSKGVNDDAAGKGWYVTLYDTKTGTVLISEEQLPAQGSVSTEYHSGRRWEKDFFNEAIDARLQVEWKSTDESSPYPVEAYDATIELQVARQRRST